jgi:predicted DNA-binding transcriptional regulator YafY
VHAEGHWYLLAHCEVSGTVRIFRMDRILAATPGEGAFEVPAAFDAASYIQGARVYRGSEATMVRVRYSPRIARWLAEREDGEWDPGGGFTVAHPVVDPYWLVRHVLQYGPDAEVLEPAEAREWVREVVAGMGS